MTGHYRKIYLVFFQRFALFLGNSLEDASSAFMHSCLSAEMKPTNSVGSLHSLSEFKCLHWHAVYGFQLYPSAYRWLPIKTTPKSVIYVPPRYRDICEATQVTFRSSALRHPGLCHAANTPAHMQATGGRHMLHRTVRVR